MYSLLYREDYAHDNSIWCCAWGKYKDVDDTEESYGISSSFREPNGLIDCLITGSVDESVKIWLYKNREMNLKYKFDHSLGISSVGINTKGTSSIDAGPIGISCLDFSPDDNMFVWGSNSGKITFHDVESGKMKYLFKNEAMFIMSIAYSPDGNSVASGTMSGTITSFDVATGKMLHSMRNV